jgi:hypothetical protein
MTHPVMDGFLPRRGSYSRQGRSCVENQGTARFVIAKIKMIGDGAFHNVPHEIRFAARSQVGSAEVRKSR